ncbi:MAG: O-phosphoserine--tRNA ligase, partial [Desulfobacterales bacterium]|nr:O-phosphoserine--tRNA ligase [Desulfobacterales bacterium]
TNFKKTWLETSKLIPINTKVDLKRKGVPHPLRDMIQKSREILLDLGFDEVENKTILRDADVYREYGPEAPIILERAFYLAKLPRPDIGLSNEKISQLEEIIGEFDASKLQKILRSYKKGEIESDDFIEELVTRLHIKEEQAAEMLDKVFLEFKKLRPLPTDLTLRSHMSGTWYHTLSALQDKRDFPLALFSVGLRYRNEQKEDASHLRVHHSASVVMMDPAMSLDSGREITRKILNAYGFEKVTFETKKATSNYYTPGLEQEVFAKYGGEWFEIADIGMYSPISLANFEIKYPVFNAGFGVERLVMVLNDYKDIKELVYPQFSKKEFTDQEIARSMSFIEKPQTEKGRKIAMAIEETAAKYKNEIGPCEFMAWEDNDLEVKLLEKEKGKKLVGPAGFNQIAVDNGVINGGLIPSGVSTGFSFMRAIAMKAGAITEKAEKNVVFQVKMVRALSDINLRIPVDIREYLEGNQKELSIDGPAFVTIKSRIKGSIA